MEVRGRVIVDERGRATRVSGVSFDISERKQMEAALRESDRRKDEFLAMLAHELRNPLAPIRHAGELLLRLAPAEGRVGTAVKIVNRQALQLTRMVDDLLDVSRITQGRIELEHRPVVLGQVIAAAMEAVEGLIREKRHHVTLVSGLDPVTVVGDAARLQQCVVNLMTNAAKYTDPGGELRVELRREGAEAVLSVCDNGVGIDPHLLPSVFDLFVQSDRTLDRSLGGLGIGLSVVKRLVEMHGGTVSATSQGVGHGAAFFIRLPAVQPAAAQDGAPHRQAGPCRKVLIVDDNRDAAESLALVLSLDGHEVFTAFGPEEALVAARDIVPDVVLLDIGLPRVDGYEVARRLRAETALAKTRIIALTGYGQQEDRRRTRRAGFDGHLVKPVSVEALGEILRAAGVPLSTG